MLTAMALFQEGETPLGRVGYLNESLPDLDEMTEHIARAFRVLEATEVERGQDQRDALFMSMRRLAKEYGDNG